MLLILSCSVFRQRDPSFRQILIDHEPAIGRDQQGVSRWIEKDTPEAIRNASLRSDMDVVKRDTEKSDKQSRTEGSERPVGADKRDWLRLIQREHFQGCSGSEVISFCRRGFRFAFADNSVLFDEERDVSTARNDDANSFVDAFAGEILVKSLPQQTGVIAHNVVFAGVVSVGSSKDLFADLLLSDLASLIEQILFADIEDKAGEKFGFDEALAAGDTSG